MNTDLIIRFTTNQGHHIGVKLTSIRTTIRIEIILITDSKAITTIITTEGIVPVLHLIHLVKGSSGLIEEGIGGEVRVMTLKVMTLQMMARK